MMMSSGDDGGGGDALRDLHRLNDALASDSSDTLSRRHHHRMRHRRRSFGRNATAHGPYVCGLLSSTPSSDASDEVDGDAAAAGAGAGGVAWKTRLPADVVGLSTSTSPDSGLIVATTAAGDVSLLRGEDGCVLATRNVVGGKSSAGPTTSSKEGDENDDDLLLEGSGAGALDDYSPLLVAWIRGYDNGHSSEALLVETRVGSTDTKEAGTGNSTSSSTNFILVTQMGSLLNTNDQKQQSNNTNNSSSSPNDDEKKDGSDDSDTPPSRKNLQIDALVLPREVRAVAGTYSTTDNNRKTLRLLACTADGSLTAFDYDLEKKVVRLVQDFIPLVDTTTNTSLGDGGASSWFVDYDLGITTVQLGDDDHDAVTSSSSDTQTYFVLSAYSSSTDAAAEQTALVCLDPASLRTVSRYAIDPASLLQQSRNDVVDRNREGAQHSGTTRTPSRTTAAASSRILKTPGAASRTTAATSHRRQERPKILALEPLSSCSPDTLAVALAVSHSQSSSSSSSSSRTAAAASRSSGGDSSTTTRVLVLQWLTEETMGLRILSAQPHLLYSIPLLLPSGSPLESVELAAIAHNCSSSAVAPPPYGFRLKLWRRHSEDINSKAPTAPCSYKAFGPSSGRQVGEMGRLLELKSFDQVDAILTELMAGTTNGNDHGSSSNYQEVEGKYACITPSFVASKRLQCLLQQGRLVDDAAVLEQAQDCFRRLATSAVLSQNNHHPDDGLSYLLEASTAVVRSLSEPRLEEMKTVLSVLIATLDRVHRALTGNDDGGDSKKRQVERHKKSLEDRLAAIDFLATTLEEDTITTDKEDGESSTRKNIRFSEPFHSIRSPAHLFELLVYHGYYAVAENLYRSSPVLRQQWLTPDVLVRSVVKIGPDVPPRRYVSLLAEVVLPSLSLGHELLGVLRSWACRTAEALEAKENDSTNNNGFGLEAAILLLEVVDKGTKNIQVAVHSSFAEASPFVDRDESRTVKRPLRSGDSMSDSRDSPSVSAITPSSNYKSRQRTFISQEGVHPIPTILELGALKRGATKSRLRVVGAADDGEEACVEERLRDAVCLRQARRAGLQPRVVSLRSYVRQGGALFIAKELVGLLSSQSATDRNAIQSFLTETVKPFCNAFGVDYDKALLEYVLARCRGRKTGVDEAVRESSSVARCCTSDINKSQAALAVLRAALLCVQSPDWLSSFSKDAMRWASCDSSLQSEVQEASRLLSIDAIVLKYCGSGARELFQVDNPSHVVRLMEFVTRHVHEESVLSDGLSLCDAYIHLSACDVSCSLLEQAMLQGDPELCSSFMAQICSRDPALAEKVLAGVVSYAEELLVESSKYLRTATTNPDRLQVYRRQGKAASECGSAVVEVVLQHTRTISTTAGAEIDSFLRNNNSLDCLREDFLRINRLQTEFSIWLSLSDLFSPKRILDSVSKLLQPVVDAYTSNCQVDTLGTKVAMTRRACSLLVGGSTKDANAVWVAVCTKATVELVRSHNDESIFELMLVLGMFDANQTDVASILSVALALCMEASADIEGPGSVEGMYRIVKAASLLRDRALSYAVDAQLPATVSFGALVETACEMLARSDEGRGEALDSFRQSLRAQVWTQTLPPGLQDTQSTASADVPVPIRRESALHESWYVGDGLLLPPRETLLHGIRFCRNIMGDLNDGSEVMEFLRRSGAHFLSLRVLTSTVVHFTSTPRALSRTATTIDWDGFAADATRATTSLAERSLGGSSQIGITSGIVDSQLSVAFLLTLQVKEAFKMYKSSLPTALKSRDYNRLLTLAGIGLVACSAEEAKTSGGFASVGWKGQRRFFEQCQKLATRAHWWTMLRDYGVTFEPNRFDEESSGSEGSDYAASLLLPAIKSMSSVHDSSVTLEILTRFAKAFGLSRSSVVNKNVEFYLSPTDEEVPSRDVRLDLNKCESVVKSSLRLLDSSLKHCKVLRHCLVNLEKSKDSGRDYERLSLVLALYHEALIQVVDHDPSIRSCELQQFEQELELVDRRRDALSILSSFFRERSSERPDFPSFFLPLKDPVARKPSSRNPRTCGVLGAIQGGGGSSDVEVFDPLQPLEKTLSGSLGMAATTALAPMFISLGLPQGYIHARSLILKFQRASSGATNFPSFENDVLPVLNRVRSSGERTELAEWCAIRYLKNDEEKLKCLDVALKNAMEFSSELESRRRYRPTEDNEVEAVEQKALQNIKRISSVKAELSDILRVKAILRGASTSRKTAMAAIVDELIAQLDCVVQKQAVTPENLIEFLLTTGSLVAANAALDSERPLSTVHLRELCSVVHEACKSISEQHSHVISGRHCRRLARKWLFYGDSSVTVVADDTHDHKSEAEPQVIAKPLLDIQEDETVNFVMDLADLHDEHDWETNGLRQSPVKQRFTSEEEPSAIKETSFREESESSCQRSALRIAFVLAFADDASDGSATTDRENSGSTSNQPLSAPSKRSGLLAKMETKKESRLEHQVLEHSRELLKTAFAQASSSTNLFNISIDRDESMHHQSREAPKTITFAMRHRALRAASILCPQEALERVIQDEGFLDGVGGGIERTSLKTCAFGAFVAKEIEEIGLSLPHSDLGHISSMHYPSYARTLWRDHRGGDQRGRMLLLLIELSLKSEDSIDNSFIDSLLEEMTRLYLPRTLLLASERIAKYEDCRLVSQPSLVGLPFMNAVSALTEAVLSEARRVANADAVDNHEATLALCSVRRLGYVAGTLSTSEEGQEQLLKVSEVIIDLSRAAKHPPLSDGLQSTSARIVRRLRKDLRPSSLPESTDCDDDDARSAEQSEEAEVSDSRLLPDALQRLEASLAYCIIAAAERQDQEVA